MAYTATTTTHKLLKMRKRIRAVAGGTSAGKTISILTILMDDAMTDTSPTLTSVVSESFPHLRRGVLRDFMAIMQQHGYWKDERWSKTDWTYTFESGSKIEFFSADQPGKVRGPRRDRLFVNEANNVPFEAYDQLAVRTKEYIWLDWNPTNEYWFYTDVLPTRDDVDFVTVTYKDNEGLDPNIIADIEAHKPNKAWWKVYGLGQLGEVEGRIFTGWNMIDEIPHEAKLEVRGLDFGFAADPDALCDIYSYQGGYIVDELLYRKGMTDSDLATFIMNQPNANTLTVADSEDGKAIEQLRQYGVSVMPVDKRRQAGVKFTLAAIRYAQGQRMSITKRSTNYIKSYRNFMWMTDRDGKIVEKYDHFWSDGMMSVIYGLQAFKPREEEDIEQYQMVTNFSL